jgi:hypothetical protein
MVVAGIAGTVYTFYWLKNKAISKVSPYACGMVRSPAEVRVAHGNTGSLLSLADLHQVLGVAIEKTEEIMEGADPGVPTSRIRRFRAAAQISLRAGPQTVR